MKPLKTKKELEKIIADRVIFGENDETKIALFKYDTSKDIFEVYSDISLKDSSKEIKYELLKSEYNNDNFPIVVPYASGNMISRVTVAKSEQSLIIYAYSTFVDYETAKIIKTRFDLTSKFEMKDDVEVYQGAIIFVNSKSTPIVRIFDKVLTKTKVNVQYLINESRGVVFESTDHEVTISRQETTTNNSKMKIASIKDMVTGYYSTSSYVREFVEYDSKENPNFLVKYLNSMNRIGYKRDDICGDIVEKVYFKDTLLSIATNKGTGIDFTSPESLGSNHHISYASQLLNNESLPDYVEIKITSFGEADKEVITDTLKVTSMELLETNKAKQFFDKYNISKTKLLNITIFKDSQEIAKLTRVNQGTESTDDLCLIDEAKNIITSRTVINSNSTKFIFKSESGIEVSSFFNGRNYNYADNDFRIIDGKFESITKTKSDPIFNRNKFGIPNQKLSI